MVSLVATSFLTTYQVFLVDHYIKDIEPPCHSATIELSSITTMRDVNCSKLPWSLLTLTELIVCNSDYILMMLQKFGLSSENVS